MTTNNGLPQTPYLHGERKGLVGRPKTGRTTETVRVRLPIDIIHEIKRRAAQNGYTVNRYLGIMIIDRTKWRPGEGTRRRLERDHLSNAAR